MSPLLTAQFSSNGTANGVSDAAAVAAAKATDEERRRLKETIARAVDQTSADVMVVHGPASGEAAAAPLPPPPNPAQQSAAPPAPLPPPVPSGSQSARGPGLKAGAAASKPA